MNRRAQELISFPLDRVTKRATRPAILAAHVRSGKAPGRMAQLGVPGDSLPLTATGRCHATLPAGAARRFAGRRCESGGNGGPNHSEFEHPRKFEHPDFLAPGGRGNEAGGMSPSRAPVAVRDRHLRLAHLALLPPAEGGHHPVGLAGSPVRVRLLQSSALQEAVPRLPQERHRLLPGGEAGELIRRLARQTFAAAHRTADREKEVEPAGGVRRRGLL